MLFKKNILQNLFFIIITFAVSINASINPLLTQITSINFIILFLLCLKNHEIEEKIKENYLNNKIFFIFFLYT